ncbi:MAG TPA: NADH-quinone oxidoreductase subunit NuoH [Phycisphaerae bacterium]|nr:NADH-quinone oxidoreductase subunit NuoH [Phycisphaerae bacterium]HRR83645.1 NADH-quinone oxidoreductase subunit NuoH [Phycisphaerae bacterium]
MIDLLKTQLGFSVALMVVLITIIMGFVAYAILLERKVCAWLQDRIGPNRAGPLGLLQPIADGVKFLLKEDFTPRGADRPLFFLAPCIAFAVAMIGFAVIPWGGPLDLGGPEPVRVQVAGVDIGLLYILAVGAMGVYGLVLAGWSSNNKFSFYGGMRAAAQTLSYEIPMGLAILVVVLTTGQVRLEKIVEYQMQSTWNVLLHPLAFLILLVTAFAETNRMPFDLAESEQELVGGYHTEYSSMKMALFFLGEYAHLITVSAFMTALFLGGWELFPFSTRLGWGWLDWIYKSQTLAAALCQFAIVLSKVVVFILFFMWVRWTLFRPRFDQLMRFAWNGLVPAGIALVVLTSLLLYKNVVASFWSPLCNAAVFGAAVLRFYVWSPAITGRQANLPPIEGSLTRRFE